MRAERAQDARGGQDRAHAHRRRFKFYLDDGSWVLMRMSGTEPLMRVYAEAPTHERVEELIGALENAERRL